MPSRLPPPSQPVGRKEVSSPPQGVKFLWKGEPLPFPHPCTNSASDPTPPRITAIEFVIEGKTEKQEETKNG